TGTTLPEARAQALTDRDTGVLLIRDAGSIIDTSALQQQADLPRLIRCGRHIARTRRYLIGYAEEVEPEDLPEAVTHQAARGDGWVKLVGDWIDRSAGDLAPCWDGSDFAAAAAAAHAAGARITTHTFDEETLPLVLDAGFDCLEHATGLTGATIARAAEAGVPVVTTLVNVDEYETYASQGERKFPGYATHMRRLRAGRLDRTRDAVDAGVVLLAGTDSGGVLGHGIIHDELDELARAGLTGTQILEAAAWAPRSFRRAPGTPAAITGRCGSAPTWCWTVASSPIETVPRGSIPSWSLISPPSRRVPRGTRSRVEPGPRPWHNRPLYVPRPALYPLQARHLENRQRPHVPTGCGGTRPNIVEGESTQRGCQDPSEAHGKEPCTVLPRRGGRFPNEARWRRHRGDRPVPPPRRALAHHDRLRSCAALGRCGRSAQRAGHRAAEGHR